MVAVHSNQLNLDVLIEKVQRKYEEHAAAQRAALQQPNEQQQPAELVSSDNEGQCERIDDQSEHSDELADRIEWDEAAGEWRLAAQLDSSASLDLLTAEEQETLQLSPRGEREEAVHWLDSPNADK